jgi:hypothetical protein
VKEYKSTTRGRFADTRINDPGLNFIKDKQWISKANPIAK